MHIERLGVDEVEGILSGHCCISTMLDGTSAVVWMDDDNQGCAQYVYNQLQFRSYLEAHPTHILYGEFLVKQHIKTYEPTAWLIVFALIFVAGCVVGGDLDLQVLRLHSL